MELELVVFILVPEFGNLGFRWEISSDVADQIKPDQIRRRERERDKDRRQDGGGVTLALLHIHSKWYVCCA